MAEGGTGGEMGPILWSLGMPAGRAVQRGEHRLLCSSVVLQHEEEGARASRSPGFSLWGKEGPIAAGQRVGPPERKSPVGTPEGLDGGERKEENRSPGELSLHNRRLRVTKSLERLRSRASRPYRSRLVPPPQGVGPMSQQPTRVLAAVGLT